MKENDLPDAELEVLACLHRLGGEATARQIRETMSGYRPMAHGSMVTLLKRLEAKGLVMKSGNKIGKAFFYQPTRDCRSTYRPVIRSLVRRIFGGDGVALVASLFETHPPTKEEINQLQGLLDQLRRKRGPKRRRK